MKTLLAAILLLLLCILGMCIGILVRGRFPETEVSKNTDMRRLGIKCMREEEDALHGRKRSSKTACCGEAGDACAGCSFYQPEKTR